MGEENSNSKASLISIIILFLVLILISIFVIKTLNTEDVDTKSFSLVNTDSKEYIASQKVDIDLCIKSLNKLYGINVMYGQDTINYANKVEATILTDINTVNNNLQILYHTLEKYPKSMFNNFKNDNYKLDVILLDKFTNSNIALASKNSLNEIKLYVSNADNFERAVHHELFHIFEYYMEDRNPSIFKNWMDFNPKNFAYKLDVASLNNDFVYLKEDNQKIVNKDESYFVTKYAKYSDKEDRAETFAEIMILANTPDYLNKQSNIRKKVDNILTTMNEYFDVGNLYCNKFVK